MTIDMKSEIEFNRWLESIKFIDKKGEILPIVLKKDKSSDPEGDRE